MQVAVNADEYANPRVNIFFTANNQTPNDGNLTGQCVTLVKWFMAEMSDVPNPFAGRGHARYLGGNLVAQGLADQVPAGQQKRGDVVCYEYGEYGHTGILLSGNRFFQQNANAPGTQRRVLADGTVVYSSSIVSLYASLGGVAPKFYRLKTYKEGNVETNLDQARAMAFAFEGRDGYYGPNALAGACDADLNKYVVGKKKLDVALGDFYTSATANDFRGRYMPALVANSNKATLYQRQAEALLVQNKKLQDRLSAYENDDTIVITKKGWLGVFDVIREYFKKLNV